MKPERPIVVSPVKTSPSGAAETGFGKVTGYRLYCLDGANKVASAEWIEADDDQDAVEAAKQMMDGHDCEVWQGKRLIARLPRHRDQ